LSEVTKRHSDVQDSLLRYSQSLLIQISQSAACNARHVLPRRLARWLLMAHDRADGTDLPLSHEFLSMMLGTRRAGVSVALSKFRAAGLIRNGHGRITITDRPGLEGAACECYRVVTAEIARLLA
jgi:CRP-like cAMP-binding protein